MSEDSPSRDNLVSALARAQMVMSHPKKTKTNPHYKSDYADLADVLNAVRPALNEQGIAVIQTVEGGDLVTELRWNDETISSRLPLNLDVKPQELGSQLSYLRRYALSAIAGVASESDDDGHAASTATRVEREPAASDEARERAQASIAALDDGDKTRVADWFAEHKVPSLKKPGATLTQLNELADYITQLTTEPWPVEGEGEGSAVEQVAPSRPEPTEKPFAPVVFNPETGQSEPVNPAAKVRAGLSGTERKAANSAMKAER